MSILVSRLSLLLALCSAKDRKLDRAWETRLVISDFACGLSCIHVYGQPCIFRDSSAYLFLYVRLHVDSGHMHV